MQRASSDFFQQATSAISNKKILKQGMSEFLQWSTSATGNERILLTVTSDFSQRAISATSNERILQRVTSVFTTSNELISRSNEQRVKSYVLICSTSTLIGNILTIVHSRFSQKVVISVGVSDHQLIFYIRKTSRINRWCP